MEGQAGAHVDAADRDHLQGLLGRGADVAVDQRVARLMPDPLRDCERQGLVGLGERCSRCGANLARHCSSHQERARQIMVRGNCA